MRGNKMATQSSPVITGYESHSGGGHDSMLFNIGGVHNAYFTRNIVELIDNAGHTGIGEVLGGDVIYQTLVDAIPMVLGREAVRLNKVSSRCIKVIRPLILIPSCKGARTLNYALTPWRR